MRRLMPLLVLLSWPAAAGDGPTPLYAEMSGTHWALATEARDALLHGNADGARAALAKLAKHKVSPQIPRGLEIVAYQMKAAAHDGARGKTLGDVGSALGRVGVACGTCHGVARVRFDGRFPPPIEGESVAAHMQRHLGAVERMWIGVFAQDEGAWDAGLSLLGHDHAVEATVAPEGRELAVAAMARLVHELRQSGREAGTWADRGEVFGELAATCGDCHAETRGR